MTTIYNKKKDEFITKHIKDGVRTGLNNVDGSTKWENGVTSYVNWNPAGTAISPFCTTQYSNGWKKESPSDLKPVLCEKPLIATWSCDRLKQYGVTENGIYLVGSRFLYCDQENDGGGWIVIQRRKDALENFNRTFSEYQSGFGNKMESFWLGNTVVLSLMNTASKSKMRVNLLVNLELKNGSRYYAFYEKFVVSSATSKYKLAVSGYKGTAGDYLSNNHQMLFSAYDSDNDNSVPEDCGKTYGSGWWFNNCTLANLNAAYGPDSNDDFHIHWGPLKSIRYVEMKIKAVTYPFTRSFLKTEAPNRKGFSIIDEGSKKKVAVRTSDKDWELLFTPTRLTWVHTCITWSPAHGIRFYENGRLTAWSDQYTHANNTLIGSSMIMGSDTTDFGNINNVVKRLGLFFHELQPYAIQEVYNYVNFTFDDGFECWAKPTDRHHTVPDPYRVWERRSGCTPSAGTGPCADHTFGNPLGSYIHVEASSPYPPGNYSAITSPYLLPVYRCLRFRYHMRGTGQGKLHVSGDSRSPHFTIYWSAVQNNRNDWQKAEVSLSNRPQRITFFGQKNKNFESDFAIDDVSLDTKLCTTNNDCNPPCMSGTFCDHRTRTCNCEKRTHVDESCRNLLSKTVFVDAVHYWAFEDHTFIEDSLGNKHGKVNGSLESTAKGAHNHAVQLMGQPSWIIFGDFSKECLGDFNSCKNGLTLTFWLKHFIKVGVAFKQNFLTLGNVADGERGFEFGFDPAIQEGELPIISVRVNLPNKYCQYKIPVLSSVWCHLGFSFEDTNALSVYRNGILVDTSGSQSCTNYVSVIPASAVLRAGSPTQAAAFQLDELVIWNKWLEQKNFIYRYQYASNGLEQGVNLLLKLKNEVWDEDLNDLESEMAVDLTKKIIQSFQVMLVNRSYNGKPVKVIIHGFSQGSVNVNTTLLFESLTYNDTLLLERWLFEQQALNTISATVLGMSSNTVPDIYPQIVTNGKNVTAIFVNWTIGDYTTVYQLFQGCRILYRRTDEPNATFMVHSAFGIDNYTVVSNVLPGVNYTMRLLLFTLSGDGLISPVFYAKSLENVPNEIPSDPSGWNTSSTSLNFTWSHIAAQSWRGIPLGYRIKYWPQDVPLDPVLNITVAPDRSITEIASLRKYMMYCLSVAAFNSAGDGNFSAPVCVMTEEDVPDAPLDDIQIKNISAFEIQLTSTGVPFLNRNGIIIKYVLYWASADSSGTVLCFNATRITCEVKGVEPFTAYNLSVTSYTRIGVGVISNFSVLTDEHVPSLPPTDVSGYNTSSSTIRISWKAIPTAYRHGIMRGYYIEYSLKGSGIWEELIVCPNQLSANITELSAYREYEIMISGFTFKGNGSVSESVFIWTDQDTPFSPPITITGQNLSSTSLRLQWKPVPYEYARGIILGYKIIVLGYRLGYQNVSNDTSWNVTIDNENILQHVFSSFEMFTDYTFQMLAFTIKGEGNVSMLLTVRTDEDKPFKPPSNVTLKSDVWHSIQINWTSVPPEEIPGICRGYIVYYIRKEGSFDVLKNMIIPADAETVIIPYLSGFIIYGVWIAAFTYPTSIGPTANLTIKTEEWLPRIPPPDFSGVPLSSTSLGISWKQLPLELTNGIMVGYVVEYTNTNKSIALNATFPTEQINAVLMNLKKFNYYKLRIIALNVNGFGNWSDYITLRTNEDTPEKSPANATVQTASPTSLNVKWKPVPWNYRHGFIVGYTVYYRPISEAEEPLPYSKPKRIDVGPQVLELTIHNLSSFTEYAIEVLAQTVKGDGVKAAEITASTCRCFEEMLTNWRDIAPYVRTANDSHGEPIGMMPHIIHTAVYECCEECPSHTTGRIRVNYTHDGYGNPANKSEDIIVKTYIDDKTDIHFPIYGFHDQTHFSKYYAYIPIVPSAGVAFFVNKQGGKASPQNVTAAVFSCWPLIMLNLIMAFLVGLIVWLLDSNHNPDHFHGSFIRGVASGFWFAFITYTTVGYGDKTVVSLPARMFTVFWTLFGLVTFGIMMGAFSAALETMTFEETKSAKMLYGTKVAVLDNSSEHRLGLQKNSKVNTEQRYETLEDLKSAMLRSEVRGALIDAHVASYNKELFEHPLLRLNKIYDSNKAYGVVLGGPTKKIQKCLVQYLSENRAWASAHIKANSRPYTKSKLSPAMQVADGMIDESSNIFLESLNSLIGLLIAALFFGLLFEAYRRWNIRKKGPDKYKMQRAVSDQFRGELDKLLLDLKENLAGERKKLLKIIRKK